MSRGTLPARLQMASEIAAARIKSLVRLNDEMTASGSVGPFGGDTLPKKDYYALLATNKQFQAETLAKMAYANEPEKEQLKRDLQKAMELYPPQEMQPSSVSATAHLLPFPENEARGPMG